MNKIISKELEFLWMPEEDYDVPEMIAAFFRLKKASKISDLPQLIEALKSERSNSWIRELLAEAIIELDGVKCLEVLFEAFQKNRDDEYDNDGFCHCLAEMAEEYPDECKKKLLTLTALENFQYKDTAEWLLTFCESA